jgi:hypothetical protein
MAFCAQNKPTLRSRLKFYNGHRESSKMGSTVLVKSSEQEKKLTLMDGNQQTSLHFAADQSI